MKELYTAAGIFVVLILLGVWMVQNNRNEQERSWYNCGRNGEKSRRNGRHGKRKKNWKRV